MACTAYIFYQNMVQGKMSSMQRAPLILTSSTSKLHSGLVTAIILCGCMSCYMKKHREQLHVDLHAPLLYGTAIPTLCFKLCGIGTIIMFSEAKFMSLQVHSTYKGFHTAIYS